MAASLSYHEPGIEDILILSSLLLVLNLINSVLDRTLYCGLVGQVLIGIAWGTPGGKWLSSSLEDAIVQLGYLGLIMIVFEGGLSTSLATMKANLVLSAGVALTGVAAPMALSFVLAPLTGASYLQCFAAGAALCSTSLGTTFTVLSASGLASTRLGSALSTAAMMDDVVGLVMVQIISSLGSGDGQESIAPATVLRPVLVSLAFAVLVPLACRFALAPLMTLLDTLRRGGQKYAESRAVRLSRTKQIVFVVQTALLIALVVGASYAGASVLLAAYLAGIVGAWWDAKALEMIPANVEPSSPVMQDSLEETRSVPTAGRTEHGGQASPERQAKVQPESASGRTSSLDMYEQYYQSSIERVLKPFFFASIGFSIPISKMFSGGVVWRGIIYTILMLLGKALCGLWLVRFSVPVKDTFSSFCTTTISGLRTIVRQIPLRPLWDGHRSNAEEQPPPNKRNLVGTTTSTAASSGSPDPAPLPPLQEPAQLSAAPEAVEKTRKKTLSKPLSLYPAGIMSCAMIARGEIGFLISSVAEANGIFRDSSSSASAEDETSDLFLIITWAIVLCTIIGPLCVGLLVRRVKKLEAANAAVQVEGSKKDVLGVWGVS
ncbi:hypothetical protein PFICI_15031 [Pestalotiopsis fici W106-1]|uniref:Cation/H+ exchanger transmembrane domain-containing protein n=1 Tax=Pestalotiopsis fici (strain W106-1 / CGMCC3.15140) TaxID=1229662 RepID=W3WKS8_PESFW|nr:uncharacterized protein PFICI_15031 [Pestalotiopsis fici W106-1]ETS73426.1 hypothetical protein PFICI_15031 [Pestalotiopsis fici W106-1]